MIRKDLGIIRTDEELKAFVLKVEGLRAEGLNLTQIALRVGITPTGVRERLRTAQRRFGLPIT